MKKYGIITNHCIKNSAKVLEKLKKAFDKSGLNYQEIDIDEFKSGFDMVFAVGGDGTMLKSLRYYAKTATPVMGINVGRLGFLSLVSPDKVDELGDIVRKEEYCVKDRIMLKTGNNTALNDIVIKGHSPIRSSKFNLYINDELMSEYIADGIIVSTPTGSTAYGLSAGGPILYPAIDAIEIVPICAHTMTARPLVIPAKEKITIKSVDELLDVSCDGQETVSGLNEVNITLSEHIAKLASPKGVDFYSVLKNKLFWGVSPVSKQ